MSDLVLRANSWQTHHTGGRRVWRFLRRSLATFSSNWRRETERSFSRSDFTTSNVPLLAVALHRAFILEYQCEFKHKDDRNGGETGICEEEYRQRGSLRNLSMREFCQMLLLPEHQMMLTSALPLCRITRKMIKFLSRSARMVSILTAWRWASFNNEYLLLYVRVSDSNLWSLPSWLSTNGSCPFVDFRILFLFSMFYVDWLRTVCDTVFVDVITHPDYAARSASMCPSCKLYHSLLF